MYACTYCKFCNSECSNIVICSFIAEGISKHEIIRGQIGSDNSVEVKFVLTFTTNGQTLV